jgi:hypothetical protein
MYAITLATIVTKLESFQVVVLSSVPAGICDIYIYIEEDILVR